MGPLNFRRVERQACRMQNMMDQLDVDRRTFVCRGEGTVYLEARGRCLDCGEIEKCLHWLDASDPARERPDFCPNLEVFGALGRAEGGD